MTKEQALKVPQATNSLPVAVIQAQLYNNWKDTTEEQRMKACLELCNVLGISTPLNPFRFITMNGRLVLYAPNEAAQLIAESKKASVEITNKWRDKENNIYVVEVRVSTGGRHVDNLGAISLAGLTGQKLCDAMMKCVSKAQRRTIFSAFGLSVTDDDDLEYYKQHQNQPVGVAAAEPPPPLVVGESEVTAKPLGDDELKDETTQLRSELLGTLLQCGLFSGRGAIDWVKDNSGKPLELLSADECVELLGAITEEIGHAAESDAIKK